MLSNNQISRYHTQGFLCIPNFLDPDLVGHFRETISQIAIANPTDSFDETRVEMEPDTSANELKIRRIYEPCEFYPTFREFSESPHILDSVEQLVGGNIYLHYSKINMKPSQSGSVVDWHQDLSYYPSTNSDSLAILIYLDDADLDNGCLMVLPGRHNNPPMDHTSSGIFQGRITENIDESEITMIEGRAGTAIFLHCLTPHASQHNYSNRQRRTLIISYRATDSFPIFVNDRTEEVERYLRLVRGKPSKNARLTFNTLPMPTYLGKEASLYDLQASSRKSQL